MKIDPVPANAMNFATYFHGIPRPIMSPEMTDDAIREFFKRVFQNYNGDYIDKICANCGAYTCAPDAYTMNAKVLRKCCKKCNEEE